MDKGKAQTARRAGWFCIGLSIVTLALFIFKSAAGRDPSPALLVISMALLVMGIYRTRSAKKLS